MREESLAFAAANESTNQRPPGLETASRLDAPQQSNCNDANSSQYLASFCCRAAWSAAPFIVAPPGHGSPVVVNADLIVMSNGQLSSMARSSVALTGMFMSRNFTMVRTTAPASRHTLARVLSVGIALQPTRSGTCCPVASRTVEPCAALAPSFCDVQWETQPLQQQRSVDARLQLEPAAHDLANNTVSRKWYSEAEDA